LRSTSPNSKSEPMAGLMPRGVPISRHHEAIRPQLKDHQGDEAWSMIRRLNQTVQGWCNYHRHACSSRIFIWVDSWLFWEIKRWLHRRHPNKGRRWIMNKYYRRIKNSRCNFHAVKTESDRKRSIRDLIKASRIRIVRHVKIRAETQILLTRNTSIILHTVSQVCGTIRSTAL
jgi:RNA-directed DNA polymerase